MNQIQLNKSVGASSAPTEAYTDAFQTFWRAYPKRVEKRKAWRCWKIRLRAGATADQMTAAAGNYARSVEGKDRQFVKHPSTFLGPDEPWREYVEGAPPAGGVGDGFFDSRAVNR